MDKSFNQIYDIITDEAKKNLLLKYAPKLYFAEDEIYFPSSVESYFNNTKRILNSKDGWYYLSNPDDSNYLPVKHAPYIYGDLGAPTYSYFVMVGNRIRLIYFFFFPYNNVNIPGYYGQDHYGDWENVSIDLQYNNDSAIIPLKVRFEAHGVGTTMDWNNILIEESYPVAFIASGSHGTWATDGNHGHYWYHKIVPDRCNRGHNIKYTFYNLVMFDVNLNSTLITGRDLCTGQPWPTWMSADYNNSNSLAVYRWGDIDCKLFADGPTGPIDKGLLQVSSNGVVFWGNSEQYDNGNSPSVAITNDGTIIEVHKSESNDKLWYRVAKLNSGNRVFWSDSIEYDSGDSPSVAVLDDYTIIEVHKSESNDKLWYHVGKLNSDNTINWGDSIEYDSGVFPSVAIAIDGTIIEVHKSETNDKLWYNVGKLNSDNTINWGDSIEYDSGVTPSVAITNDGTIIEVHQSETNDKLWYNIGKLNSVNTINWGDSIEYDSGVTPSVAITNDGTIIEVHQSGSNDKLWYHVGKLNSDNTINWGDSIEYDSGVTPSVAITSDGTIIEVHKSENYDTIWYESGICYNFIC